MTEIERLREQLKHLRLHTMAGIFEDETAKSQMSYTAFLARLVDEEELASWALSTMPMTSYLSVSLVPGKAI